jgi:hypothetical protein
MMTIEVGQGAGRTVSPEIVRRRDENLAAPRNRAERSSARRVYGRAYMTRGSKCQGFLVLLAL